MAVIAIATVMTGAPAVAEEGADQQAELAKKRLNPLASLISVPLQNNEEKPS